MRRRLMLDDLLDVACGLAFFVLVIVGFRAAVVFDHYLEGIFYLAAATVTAPARIWRP